MSNALKFSVLIAVLLFSVLTGCAHFPGGISDASTPLEGKTYEVLGNATGEDNYITLLGLIPLSSPNSTSKALAEAVSSLDGDALINVTVESYGQWFLLVTRVVTVVQGDVIKFTGPPVK